MKDRKGKQEVRCRKRGTKIDRQEEERLEVGVGRKGMGREGHGEGREGERREAGRRKHSAYRGQSIGAC